jgi:hypothetical protein
MFFKSENSHTNTQSTIPLRHPYHNNISLKDKTAKPAFKTYITCSQAPPAPTHANIQPCLTKPFHLYLVIFR